MSASFNGSTHIQGAFSGVTAYPLSMYVRGQSTTTAAEQHAFLMGSVGTDDDVHTLAFRGDVASDPMQWRRSGPVGAVGVNSVAGFTANTWADLCGVDASATDARFYANNVKATNSTNVTFANGNVIIGGFMALNSISGRLNGLAACCAIWDATLTDDDVASLYKGFSPRRVRPQNLKFYAPLVRQFLDVRGGISLSVTGTSAVGVHPRSYGI